MLTTNAAQHPKLLIVQITDDHHVIRRWLHVEYAFTTTGIQVPFSVWWYGGIADVELVADATALDIRPTFGRGGGTATAPLPAHVLETMGIVRARGADRGTNSAGVPRTYPVRPALTSVGAHEIPLSANSEGTASTTVTVTRMIEIGDVTAGTIHFNNPMQWPDAITNSGPWRVVGKLVVPHHDWSHIVLGHTLSLPVTRALDSAPDHTFASFADARASSLLAPLFDLGDVVPNHSVEQLNQFLAPWLVTVT